MFGQVLTPEKEQTPIGQRPPRRSNRGGLRMATRRRLDDPSKRSGPVGSDSRRGTRLCAYLRGTRAALPATASTEAASRVPPQRQRQHSRNREAAPGETIGRPLVGRRESTEAQRVRREPAIRRTGPVGMRDPHLWPSHKPPSVSSSERRLPAAERLGGRGARRPLAVRKKCSAR